MEPLLINTALKGLFEQKVEKTNRKAAKLGMAPVSFSYGAVIEVSVGSDTIGSYDVIENGRKVRKALYVEVTLDGQAPVIEGYEFVATVDLRGETAIVKRQPFSTDEGDLMGFHGHNDGHCDHCGMIRRRNDALILRDTKTRELIQIGRNCAADFFRSKDASAMLAVSDWIESYGNVTDPSGRAEPYSSVERMYQVAAAVVRTFGWVAVKDTHLDNSLVSTRSRVWANLFPWPKMPVEDKVTVLPEDIEEAKVVMQWLHDRFLSKDDGQCNEFERNVKAAVEYLGGDVPLVRNRNLNFLIWGIGGYKRDLQKDAEERRRKAEAAKQQAASEFVGVPGERRDFVVTLKFKRVFGGEYGPRYMQKFEDADGNVIVWWGTNDAAARTVVGNTYVLKATIKGHDLYEGVKQTTLTRATVIEGELKEEGQ